MSRDESFEEENEDVDDDDDDDDEKQIDPKTGKRMFVGFQHIRVLARNEDDLEVLRFLAKGGDYFTYLICSLQRLYIALI